MTTRRRAAVLRHRVTGAIKHTFYPDLEDSMWELMLGTGSIESQGAEIMRSVEEQQRNQQRQHLASNIGIDNEAALPKPPDLGHKATNRS